METTVAVSVDRDEQYGQWRVRVDLPDGSRFATVQTDDLDTALRMAVPYIASAAEPDPFAELLRGAP